MVQKQVERYLKCYEEGSITGMEASIRIIEQVTEDNALDIIETIKTCPHVYEAVKDRVETFAALSEEQRQQMRTFQMGSYIIRSDADLKRFEAEREKEHQAYLRGAKILCDIWREAV